MRRSINMNFSPDEYRDIIKTHKHRTGLTWLDIATRMGIDKSALNNFTNGASDLAEENIAKLKNYVHHNVCLGDDIIPTMTHQSLMQYFSHAYYTQSIYAITGKSGFGKTATAKHFARVNEFAYWINGTVDMGAKDLMLEILSVIGIPIPAKSSSKYVLQQLVVEQLSGRAGILIVDEADKLSIKALDALREITDNEKVILGMVLLGEASLVSKLQSKDQSGISLMRLYSRLSRIIPIDKIEKKDVMLFLREYGITKIPQSALDNIYAKIDRRGGYRYLKMIAESLLAAMKPSDEQRAAGEVNLELVRDVLSGLPA